MSAILAQQSSTSGLNLRASAAMSSLKMSAWETALMNSMAQAGTFQGACRVTRDNVAQENYLGEVDLLTKRAAAWRAKNGFTRPTLFTQRCSPNPTPTHAPRDVCDLHSKVLRREANHELHDGLVRDLARQCELIRVRGRAACLVAWPNRRTHPRSSRAQP